MGDTGITRGQRIQATLDITPLLAVIEQWPGALLLFDADARLYWCNERARQLTRTQSDELMGLGASALGVAWIMAPDQFVAALAGGEQLFRAGPVTAPLCFQVRLRRIALGAGRDAVLCMVEEGAFSGLEPGLAPSESSFDAVQAGVWHWNLETHEASVDEAWCRHLQLDPCSGDEHPNRWTLQIHPDDSADYRRRLQEMRSGANPYFEDEYRILTLDNRWLWILQRGRVVARNEAGQPVRVIGICIDIDRRKREETASKENESRLATALWGARAAFWQWHLPTDVRTMSPMWYAMTRYTREQWDQLPDPWLSRLHAEDREAVIAAVEQYRNGTLDSLEYEYRLKISSGEWKWLLDRARAVEWDLEGNPTVIMGVTLDIDAQKRAEMALRKSEDRLQTAVWGARMGLFETDLSTDTTRWFDQWCEQYGVDSCEGSQHQQRWLEKIHSGDAAEAMQRYQDHLDGKQDFYDSEYRVRTADGSWRWIYARARVTERDESGTAVRVVGVCMDVDARRRAEMQKHFTQPWLEAALQIARCGMWHWQIEPREITYTDSYYRLFGVDPLVGRAEPRYWYHNIHPDDRERATRLANDLVDGTIDRYEQEYRMRCADGRWMWVLDRACAMQRDAQGRGQYLVGFVIDFSERREQREALRVSDEMFRYATAAAGGIVVEMDFATGRVMRHGIQSLLGYEDHEMPTRWHDWELMLHPEDLELLRAYRGRESLQGHNTVIEYRVRHKAGHYVRIRGAGITLADASGRPTRRIGFLQRADLPAGGVLSRPPSPEGFPD
jgi:PAS domain S-box-containing protein